MSTFTTNIAKHHNIANTGDMSVRASFGNNFSDDFGGDFTMDNNWRDNFNHNIERNIEHNNDLVTWASLKGGNF